MFFQKHQAIYLARFASLFKDASILHGVSTRKKGVSLSPFHSLNLAVQTEDDPGDVIRNREIFFDSIGINESAICQAQQVHGTTVQIVEQPGDYPETDGFITSIPELMLTIRIADCLPVFLYTPQNRIIGLVHAGWRGTSQKITKNAANKMIEHFGVGVKNIHAFLGPSIGPCCYQVGDEVAKQFPSNCVQSNKLNLWKANRDQLIQIGVLPSNINVSQLCTCCHQEWFYSHRGSDGKTGRILAFFMLKQTSYISRKDAGNNQE